jgi:endonuclease-3
MLAPMGRAKGAPSAKGRSGSARVSEVLERLEARYGKPRYQRRLEPMDELVSCILSQHTSDATSFPAFHRLKATYPEWQDVVDAGPESVADVVRSAGLANQKARSIIRVLNEIYVRNGEYSIENLRGMPMLDARAWLQSLPGVGPKTASIVMCFSFGMNAIPVDTHIYRVSKRLGFVSETTDANKAHDLLLKVVAEEDAYRYHVLLIQHGRQVCKAQRPLCIACELLDLCPYGKRAVKS